MKDYRFWGKQRPSKQEDFFNVATPRASADESTATIRVYGPIDSWGGIWGVSAQEVSQALDELPDTVTEIQLRLNSPGGDGYEGLAILNMLRAHPARVVAVVDGLAASAASFIAAGCDETVMSPGTQMMIHDAWGFAMGNAADMAKAQSFLNSISDSIAELYAESAGGTRAKWRALMVEETWFTATEAVSAQLADRVAVVGDVGVTTTAAEPAAPETDEEFLDRFDLTVFKYAGRNQAPEPDTTSDPVVPDEAGDTTQDMDKQSTEQEADPAAGSVAEDIVSSTTLATPEPTPEPVDEQAMTAKANDRLRTAEARAEAHFATPR